MGRSFDRSAIHTLVCMKPFRDGLGEVQSRREWSLYRRSDTGLEGCFERALYHLPPGAEGDDGFQNKLELNPVALRWRRGRFEGCSFNVTVSRR